MYRKVNTIGRGRATAMLFGFGRVGALPSYQDKSYQDASSPVPLVFQPLEFQPLTDLSVNTRLAPDLTTETAKTGIQVDVVSTASKPAPDSDGIAPSIEMTKPLVEQRGTLESEVFVEREAQVREAVEKELTATRDVASKEARALDLEDAARRQANFEDAQRLLGEAEATRREVAVAKEVVAQAKQERVEVAQKPPEVLLADAGTRKTKNWAWIAGGALLVKFLLF